MKTKKERRINEVNNKAQRIMLLTTIFVTLLVISNIVSTKVFSLNIGFLHYKVILPCGIICYPITYLVTDIVGELYGKREAENVVKCGLLGSLIATLIIFIVRYFPSEYNDIQESYVTLLGQNWIFVAGSFISYIVSQKLDVHIFHSIRDKWLSKNKDVNKGKWIWNNVGTITSQLVDTIIYSTIAFGFGYGWLFNDIGLLINMICCQYIAKVIIALCDTPFFYLFTRNEKIGNK